ADRGRDGRRAHLRERAGGAGGALEGRHDRRLGAVALRRARHHLVADRQRGPRRQPGGLRHLVEAARRHRVGVIAGGRGPRGPTGAAGLFASAALFALTALAAPVARGEGALVRAAGDAEVDWEAGTITARGGAAAD